MPFEITPSAMPEDFLMQIARAVDAEPGSEKFDILLMSRRRFREMYDEARASIDVDAPYVAMREACFKLAAAIVAPPPEVAA